MGKGKTFNAMQVSHILNISVYTLNNWYGWYTTCTNKPDDTPVLPTYFQTGARKVRQWTEDDVELLIKFKEWVPQGRSGVMGEFNNRYTKQKIADKVDQKEMED